MLSAEVTGNARKAALATILILVALMLGAAAFAPKAYAADGDKPKSVMMKIDSVDWKKIDVTKEVATLDLNMSKATKVNFEVSDAYDNLSDSDRRRELVFEDSSGKQTKVDNASSNSNTVSFTSGQMVSNQVLKLITSTKDGSGNFVKRYECQLNVRGVDSKKAEKKQSGSSGSIPGMSNDGGSWSFSDGLQYTFNNTGISFLNGTTMNLGLIKLPITYKHNPDGTTIAGINCNVEDKEFFEAVKNGNVWQKYTDEALAKKTSEIDKGWSGKKLGTWGDKSFDWEICGFMEFNTNDPNAPRALNLIISAGISAEGHAQYLCFTGTLTFTAGGKAVLVGKLTPGKGVEGKFGLGAYGSLELFAGLGVQYIAAVGVYGKGRIDIDFDILPATKLSSIKLSGEFGVKAKVFSFTIFTWEILSGEKPLYPSGSSTKGISSPNGDDMPALNEDGTATSPFNVDADTPYPADSRAYLDKDTSLSVGQSDALTTQAADSASTILKGIYGETELTCAATNEGPVIAYIADADQVSGGSTRDAANRSALVYSRLKNGTWTDPKIIDATTKSEKFCDYTPTISTDGENCYVSWLAADSLIKEGATIGEVGKKLDVNVATITKNDKITVEMVSEESDDEALMPAGPKAVKVGSDLYVGWYTNQTSGSHGEVLGVSGEHKIKLYKRQSNGTWSKANETTTSKGAISSFDVGSFGGAATCAWSLDEKFSSASVETTLNGGNAISGSSVYALTPSSNGGQLLATQATNAQFAKYEGGDVLTYAIRSESGDATSASYLSICSFSSLSDKGKTVLDGSKVYLPTTYYEITGDLGKGRAGNVSFLVAGDGTSDIQALVTTGAGSDDWTSIVEATADTAVITDYCATYSNNLPLFIYATEPASDFTGSALNSSLDDGSVDLNRTTEDSLKHLSVSGVDYDEYDVDSGQEMPVTVHYSNDGMLDVSGADLWVLEDGSATKVASNDTPVQIDGNGDISFSYSVPEKDKFTKAHDFTVYVAPKGAAVTTNKIEREKASGSAATASLGAASLSLEATHMLVDGQESIVATVTNDGVVPHGAKLRFLDAATEDELATMDISELGENMKANETLKAEDGYFQNDGIKNIIVTLDDDGTDHNGYEINNTEFISTWDLPHDVTDSEALAGTGEKKHKGSTKPAPKSTSPSSKSPSTGDLDLRAVVLALIALSLIAAPAVAHGVRKARENR